MRRLPITIRLTLVFAAVMAVVLAGTGLFLYLRLGAELDRAIEVALRSRADDVSAFARRFDGGADNPAFGRLTDTDESIAQIVDARGRVVEETPAGSGRPLLAARELARARRRLTIVERRHFAAFGGDPIRLLATPVEAQGEPRVVVVGTSIDDRDEALQTLVAMMLIGGPAALLLASLTAFGVARAALRPVEGMRRQAAAISGAKPGRRLPVPATRDELSRLGETLNAMLVRLEGALAHERAFVADASHELRTPLAILKTELELAMEGTHSVEELDETIRSAAEETERLVRIAEDLLVISSSEQGELPVVREHVDAHALLTTVLHRYERRAQERGCALEIEAPAGLTVTADPLRLEQALGNMVDNALRHGGGRILVAARERDDRIELHVVDEGPGFAPEFLGRAFERFSRADAARSGRGTGLGLAVVESIAVAHGGEAHAANPAEGGADVWISLPSDAQPARASAAASGRAAGGAPRAPAGAAGIVGGARDGVMRAVTRRTAGALLAVVIVAVAALVVGAGGPSEIVPAEPDRAAPVVAALQPVGETEPVPHSGDAADDAAIWVDPRNPARSTIIGTDKDGGIAVYDLRGRELQYLAHGRLNNVDLRPGFPLGGRRVVLAGASNRADDTILLYRVDERTRRLVAVGSFRAGVRVYGLCMYHSRRTGEFYLFVDSDSGDGKVEQWHLRARGDRVAARNVRTFEVGGKAEGCVADDALGDLYIGDEDRGIWKYGAEPGTGARRTLVDSTGADGHLKPHVEGLALAEGPGASGHLIASSQGDHTFAVYRRDGRNAYVGSFRIAAANGVDDVQVTDGIAVSTASLGGRFPEGIFVAHDGRNGRANQNYKLVRWKALR
ncbi:MAG TPA: phytase [Solirubrobacteraceae bacterium]|nr:phytase [Solirubrobacteraceae bacterium]